MTMMKSKGDNGHPCLTNLVILKDLDCLPLMMTKELVVVERAFTKAMNFGPNPICCRSQYRKSHSSLLKALQMSSLKECGQFPFPLLCVKVHSLVG